MTDVVTGFGDGKTVRTYDRLSEDSLDSNSQFKKKPG